MKNYILRPFTLLLLTLTLMSHAIWMESSYKGIVGDEAVVNLYFGEFEKGLREKGKALDGMNLFRAFYIHENDDAKAISLQKADSSFQGKFIANQEGLYQILAMNDERAVQDWTKYGLTVLRPIEFQRSAFTAFGEKPGLKLEAQPFFYLDIVPDYGVNHKGEMCGVFEKLTPIEATVFLQKRPGKNIEVSLFTPAGKVLKLISDNKGQITFIPQTVGTYLLSATVNDEVPGKFKGQEYKYIRYHISTTINVEFY